MTGTQRKILAVIRRIVADRGYPPSVRELCVEVGFKSPSSIHKHLKELVELGYIEKGDGPRALRIIEQ